MTPTDSVGLYLHIPFCARKCAYCDFYSLPYDSGLVDSYVTALAQQLTTTAPQVTLPVDSIFIGGGTPSLLSDAQLDRLFNAIVRNFRVASDVETTIEANPDSLSLPHLRQWRSSGINRLSIGVQSLDDAQLIRLGRLHTAQSARDAVQNAATAGFDNLSIDLLYGLPGQTRDSWQRTLQAVSQWPITHLSCYGLKLEPQTPLFTTYDGHLPVDDDLAADQYLDAVTMLADAGFAQYEISNFAKPGRASRHNLKYWTLQPYLGFGPSAHSDYDDYRAATTGDLHAYLDGIAAGDDVLASREFIRTADRGREYLMLGLRTAHGVSAREYTSRYDADPQKPFALLAQWQQHGLTQPVGDRWRLTPQGFLISNQLISRLLDA